MFQTGYESVNYLYEYKLYDYKSLLYFFKSALYQKNYVSTNNASIAVEPRDYWTGISAGGADKEAKVNFK